MEASHSTMSQDKNPAKIANEAKRVSTSHPGCTPLQQLVHSWFDPTWAFGVARTNPSASGRAVNRLSYALSSSDLDAASFLHNTHKDPMKAATTMPKHMKSYQYTTKAMVRLEGFGSISSPFLQFWRLMLEFQRRRKRVSNDRHWCKLSSNS